MADVIIVGAGAAGLLAGCELARNGKSVIILEARDRVGGRMHTFRSNFVRPVEEGAEFIHGDLPVTISFINQVGGKYDHMAGRMWRHSGNELSSDNSFIEDDRGLIKKLVDLKTDITVKEFLETNFDKNEDAVLIHSLTKFVEGYDSADISRASTFAFRDEWIKDDDNKQFRITNGYEIVYNHLKNKFISYGGEIFLNSIVNEINWKENYSAIITSDKKNFSAEKVIITVPTGVLRDNTGIGYIKFSPSIPELDEWIDKSGFGELIKILIEFRQPFWDSDFFKEKNVKQAKQMGFLFSEEKIPTWWTQEPDAYPLLTGWIAGPDAREMVSFSDNEIFDVGLKSLSNVFEISIDELRQNISAWHVKNWTADPFTRGAYAYKTPQTTEALKKISQSFGKTVYFAGEALYGGSEMGTVEAALLSGIKVSTEILSGK